MNKQLKHLVENYQTGKLTLKERIELSEILADPENLAAEEFLHADWVSHIESEPVHRHNLNPVLERIHQLIKIKQVQSESGWWTTFQRVAAILIIPILLSFLAYFYFQKKPSLAVKDSYAEIECPMGARIKFHLPDGSSGYLNSGSTLKYAVGFTQGRKVDLSGEAYFEVVHNPEMPFHVSTKNLDIKVLGTIFNVVANDDETIEEVILKSGKVDIASPSGKQLAVLSPNEQLSLNTEKRTFTKKEVEAEQYTSWKDGKLVFRDETMQQVARRLSRWYNAEVVVDDKSLDYYTFHATFADEPLDEVLKLLSLTTPLSYTEVKRSSNADGVFQKRKIILKTDRTKIDKFR